MTAANAVDEPVSVNHDLVLAGVFIVAAASVVSPTAAVGLLVALVAGRTSCAMPATVLLL